MHMCVFKALFQPHTEALEKPVVERSDLPRKGLSNSVSSPISNSSHAPQLLTVPGLQHSCLVCFCIREVNITAIFPTAYVLWCPGVIVENFHKRVQRANISADSFNSWHVILQKESWQSAFLFFIFFFFLYLSDYFSPRNQHFEHSFVTKILLSFCCCPGYLWGGFKGPQIFSWEV